MDESLIKDFVSLVLGVLGSSLLFLLLVLSSVIKNEAKGLAVMSFLTYLFGCASVALAMHGEDFGWIFLIIFTGMMIANCFFTFSLKTQNP